MQPRHLQLLLLLLLAACTSSRDATNTVARTPAHSGEVWEVDSAANRASAPGSLEAFINGLHVIVIDGDKAYAGSQSLALTPGKSGTRSLQLADGSTAQLVGAGDAFDLRFATGERVRLHRQPTRAGAP